MDTQNPQPTLPQQTMSGRRTHTLLIATLVGLIMFGFGFASGYSVPKDHTVTQDIHQTSISPTVAQKTVVPTSTEKIYQGKYFNLTLPTSWDADADNNTATVSGNELELADFRPRKMNATTDISVSVSSETLEKVLSENTLYDEKKSVMIHGQKATQLKGYTGIAGSVYTVTTIMQVNNKVYEVVLATMDEPMKLQRVQEYEKILDTITFK